MSTPFEPDALPASAPATPITSAHALLRRCVGVLQLALNGPHPARTGPWVGGLAVQHPGMPTTAEAARRVHGLLIGYR